LRHCSHSAEIDFGNVRLANNNYADDSLARDRPEIDMPEDISRRMLLPLMFGTVPVSSVIIEL